MQFPQLLLLYWTSSPVDLASRSPYYNSCLGLHVQILHTDGDGHRVLVFKTHACGVSLRVCMCVGAPVHVRIQRCVCAQVCVRACACLCLLIYAGYVCVGVCACVHLCICVCTLCTRVCVCVCGVAGVRGCACASACACGSLRACMCTGASVHMRVHRCVRAQCCACPCVVVLVSASFKDRRAILLKWIDVRFV
jgi:hypothetical protein